MNNEQQSDKPNSFPDKNWANTQWDINSKKLTRRSVLQIFGGLLGSLVIMGANIFDKKSAANAAPTAVTPASEPNIISASSAAADYANLSPASDPGRASSVSC
jgi:hypothetical protein